MLLPVASVFTESFALLLGSAFGAVAAFIARRPKTSDDWRERYADLERRVRRNANRRRWF